jgi:hypothetical protein
MKLVFGVVIVVVALYLCVELIPPYYANYEFEDAVKTEALMATNSSKAEEAIQETVFKKAQELQIPVTRENIHVTRAGSQFVGSVSIEVPYNVHLDMAFYPMDLHFDVATTNKGAM